MASCIPTPKVIIKPTVLTPGSFAPFGTVILAPLPSSATTIPSLPPPNAIHANQNTAFKFANISPLTSTYHLSSTNNPAYPTMSLFSCFSRDLRSQNHQQIFDLRILERHPFTTQTFIPLSAPSTKNTKAIIIVAPTLPSPPPPSALTPYSPQSKQGGPPDLSNLKSFVAEPDMGITYGAGTWHAPMVVVGEGRMDFVVTQWVNGREEDDCQEVEIAEGVQVVVNLKMNHGRGGPKL